MLKHVIAAAAVLGSALAAPAWAAPLTLNLTSGTYSDERGPTQSPDTYREAGFALQVETAGNHIDPGAFSGDIGFHNGPANPTQDNNLILTFGGSAFQFLGVDIGDFANGATSLELTGSNGATASFTATGFNATTAFSNVTSITFSINPNAGGGNAEGIGLNGLSVDTTPLATAVPEPASLALAGLGLVAALTARRRQRGG